MVRSCECGLPDLFHVRRGSYYSVCPQIGYAMARCRRSGLYCDLNVLAPREQHHVCIGVVLPCLDCKLQALY